MSHYTVLVVDTKKKGMDELLHDFNENLIEEVLYRAYYEVHGGKAFYANHLIDKGYKNAYEMSPEAIVEKLNEMYSEKGVKFRLQENGYQMSLDPVPEGEDEEEVYEFDEFSDTCMSKVAKMTMDKHKEIFGYGRNYPPQEEAIKNFIEVQGLEISKEATVEELVELGNEALEKAGVNGYLEIYEDDCGDKVEKHIYGYATNAKWDWYSLGGRWSGTLPLKDNTVSDQTVLSNLKFDNFKKDVYERSKRFWEVVVEGDELKDGETQDDFPNFYKESYYKNQYGSKENYAKEQASFRTYALLIDDEWFEPGEMGWFGISDTTMNTQQEYNKLFIEKLTELSKTSPDADVYLVDCHI